MPTHSRTATADRPDKNSALTALKLCMVAWPRELNALVASYAASTPGQLAARSYPTGVECVRLPGATELISGAVDALLVTDSPDCVAAPNAILYSVAHAMGVLPARFDGEGAEVIDIRDRKLFGRPGFGNSVRFPPHTDLSYVATTPELMAMHVLAAASGGGGHTLLVSADQAVECLDPRDIELLLQPSFWFHPPAHYVGPSGVAMHPILRRRAPSGFWVRFRHDGLAARSKAAERAAQHFFEALTECQVEFTLPERSVLIVDNCRVLHGRTEFMDGGTSAPRHLKRMYMMVEPIDGAYCD